MNKITYILILISSLAMAQIGEYSKPVQYTGLVIDYRVAIPVRDVLNKFKEAGYDLDLDGTNQTVIFRAEHFSNIKRIPEGAAAIAMGKDNDNSINIWFDLDRFPYYGKWRQMTIVLHELGHDYFNLNHSDDKDSVMYYMLSRNAITEKDFEVYFNEILALCLNK